MTPERWECVKEITYRALEVPRDERESFLIRECGDDSELAAEIRSLLAEYDLSGVRTDTALFPDNLARRREARGKMLCPRCGQSFDAPAAICPNDGAALVYDPEALVGTVLDGLYEIERVIGRGGFGIVYLAHHVLLRDRVAIKVLPREFGASHERLERFLREARAARTLRHPNAVTVHDLRASADGLTYMVQEYVDGRTLREELDARGRFEPAEVVEILEPIAAALDEAHAHGIVHRDLKPDNVMIGQSDGKPIMKLLDLGIAKLREIFGAPEEEGIGVTRPGEVIGTPAYMSPEQWGEVPDDGGPEVDGRADVYSLGVLVFELVAGAQPFDGKYVHEVRRAHIHMAPPILHDVVGTVSEAFSNAIERAMAKHRGERQATAGELIAELRCALGQKPLGPARRRAMSTLKRISPALRRRSMAVVLGVAALAAGSVVTARYFGLVGLGGATPHTLTPRRLTNNGTTVEAAISQDGRYITKVVDTVGKQTLQLQDLATGVVTRLIDAAEGDYSGLTFSPDGSQVYFRYDQGERTSSLYRVSTSGGEVHLVLYDLRTSVSFSPDGTQFAFTRKGEADETWIVVANADGTNERVLATRHQPLFFSDGGAAWSPDGTTIACSAGDASNGFRGNVVSIGIEDGVEEAITPLRWNYVGSLAWVEDGAALAISARETPLDYFQLWRVSYPSGEVEPLTKDLNNYVGISASADSKTLVTIQSSNNTTLWVAHASDASDAQQVMIGSGRYLGTVWAPDGRIVYSSMASGDLEIWIMNGDGTDPERLTRDVGADRDPVVTPDGRFVVYVSYRDGKHNIWRMNIDGTDKVKLTDGTDDQFPAVTPDGNWVVYQRFVDFSPTIWRAPINGGETLRVTDTFSLWPSVSPDGTVIACSQYDTEKDRMLGSVVPITGGQPLHQFEIPLLSGPMLNWQRIRWTADQRALTYVVDREGVSNVWRQPLDGSPAMQTTFFRSERLFSYDISRDGALLCSRGVISSDVVALTGLR